jgi:hypothetical protein
MLELALAGLELWKAKAKEVQTGNGFDSGYNLPALLTSGIVTVDLSKPMVVTSIDIEPGTYTSFVIRASMTGMWSPETGLLTSRISFPVPEGFNYETHAYDIEYKGKIRGNDAYVPQPPVSYGNISIEGNIITGDLHTFEPYYVNMSAHLHGYDSVFLGHGVLGSINNIFMGGNIYKIFNSLPSTPVIKANTYLPGLLDGYLLNHPDELNILVPFESITVPENANAVRFEICWNIDNIIERYEGATSSPDDDIFILKNKFWEDFSIKAFIE